MKNQYRDSTPPAWATRFLRWYCRPKLAEDLEGDLYEYFVRNVKTRGLKMARLIYILDVLKFLRPYTIRKIEPLTFLSHFNMLGSYFKTSRRSLVRNKMFSLINIIGLAISMSVGLLAISIISDLLSYDAFQKKSDRIYRVITTNQTSGGPPLDLATTSVKIGRRLRESVPGVEDFTIMRTGYSVDAYVAQDTFSLDAMWADQSFLKVFTFPLVSGNPATALKEPYSLVVTEKTAKRMFANRNPLGQTVRMDTLEYQVTGVAKDPPHLSHIRFDALISFATADATKGQDPYFYDWQNIWSNYVYLTVPENTTSVEKMEAALAQISAEENKALHNAKVTVSLQPFEDIALGRSLSNSMGPQISPTTVWILIGLSAIIILSACFNYTNLSVARSLRRSREVGVRKIVGARRSHVLGQFITESVMIALLALVLSFGIFIFLRKQFIDLDQHIPDLLSLDLSLQSVGCFFLLAILTGIAAGLFPALFFSKINALSVMKNASGIKLFKHVGLRKVLIVIQYSFSLMFIAVTMMGYAQYKGFLNFDLGFETDQVLNVSMQNRKPELLRKELAEIPEVKNISYSNMISSVGGLQSNMVKVPGGDSAMIWYLVVDNHYLPVHQHKLVAGRNFKMRPKEGIESEAVVNEQFLKRFNIANRNPHQALGKMIHVGENQLEIVGVIKDFHYGTLDNKIEPAMFRCTSGEDWGGYLNLKIESTDIPATMEKIGLAWKKIDRFHPLEARFYSEEIEQAYVRFSVMVKIIGSIAFLAICIASLGLFGMVVFTTETKLKEISIRKVLGASEIGLIFLLCRGFLLLLLIAALIAIPATYLLFDKLFLANFAYHSPIGAMELFGGTIVVMLLAFLMISSQTAKAARSNPAKVLKSDS